MSDILRSLEKSLSLNALNKNNFYKETFSKLTLESLYLQSTLQDTECESPSLQYFSRQNSNISIESLQKNNEQSTEIIKYLKQKKQKLQNTIKALHVI